jgi:nitrogenase molybdenum-iron protein alpha/beta subunit
MPTGCPAVDSATVEKGNRLACWLWSHGHNDVDYIPFAYRGTDEVVRRFAAILDYVERVCAREGRLCDAELIPCLRGLEGRQVVLAFDDGRHVRCLIGRHRFGALAVHVAKQHEADYGEPLTFGDVRLVQVLDQQTIPGGGNLA